MLEKNIGYFFVGELFWRNAPERVEHPDRPGAPSGNAGHRNATSLCTLVDGSECIVPVKLSAIVLKNV